MKHLLVSREIRAVNSQVLTPLTAEVRHVKASLEDMWVDATQREAGYKSPR